jgi:hypothetical protein
MSAPSAFPFLPHFTNPYPDRKMHIPMTRTDTRSEVLLITGSLRVLDPQPNCGSFQSAPRAPHPRPGTQCSNGHRENHRVAYHSTLRIHSGATPAYSLTPKSGAARHSRLQDPRGPFQCAPDPFVQLPAAKYLPAYRFALSLSAHSPSCPISRRLPRPRLRCNSSRGMLLRQPVHRLWLLFVNIPCTLCRWGVLG